MNYGILEYLRIVQEAYTIVTLYDLDIVFGEYHLIHLFQIEQGIGFTVA